MSMHHCMNVEFRGQLVAVSSLLPSRGSWGSNSGYPLGSKRLYPLSYFWFLLLLLITTVSPALSFPLSIRHGFQQPKLALKALAEKDLYF